MYNVVSVKSKFMRIVDEKSMEMYKFRDKMGARRGRGKVPPPQPKKNCCRKWAYFPELYKMTKVREAGIENG